MRHGALLKTEDAVFPKRERPRLQIMSSRLFFIYGIAFKPTFRLSFTYSVKPLCSNQTYAHVRDNSGTKSDKKLEKL